MKIKDDIRLEIRMPTVNQYNALRRSVGWEEIDKYRTNLALKNSILSVCASTEDKIIGIGRVVGDGAMYFYIQDIIVCPNYQRQGIGSSIVEQIMSNVQSLTRKGSGTFIGLMADKGLANFYSKYGFEYQSDDVPFMNIWQKVSQ
ncbi:GNAT family N-acetyltransferase [Vibrio coralliilyticus]|uniref:GNAT family N-acetyltransferase n=1 Tax=Vibrio coralliilyticus TaxID=190893 RepID=UPI0015609A33|nr:GNAT family N-acetyltransferase [Vibrio coralliilyticus]NRF28145.1 GNAT family N-acetyltransferase [Vibrio coralliilyticus]NRF82271.1 GNAT family N-acetyltransferase [Vibrio coralliilyticus]